MNRKWDTRPNHSYVYFERKASRLVSLIREPCLPQFPLSKHESRIPSETKFLSTRPAHSANPPSTHEFSPRSSPRSRLSPAALRSFFVFGRIHACCVTKFPEFHFVSFPHRPHRPVIFAILARARHRVEWNSTGVEWTRVQEWFSNNRAKLRQSVYPTRFKEETLQGSNNVSRYAVCTIRDYPLRNHVPAINSSLSLSLRTVTRQRYGSVM